MFTKLDKDSTMSLTRFEIELGVKFCTQNESNKRLFDENSSQNLIFSFPVRQKFSAEAIFRLSYKLWVSTIANLVSFYSIFLKFRSKLGIFQKSLICHFSIECHIRGLFSNFRVSYLKVASLYPQFHQKKTFSLNNLMPSLNKPYIKSHADDDVTALRVKHIMKTVDMNNDNLISRIGISLLKGLYLSCT